MRLLPLLLVLASAPLFAADSPHGELSRDCAECHNAQSWTPVKDTPGFRHEDTGYVLELSHSKLRCRSCHESLVFSQIGTACVDCHRDPHRGELGTRCELCHTQRTFSNQREMFQAHSSTRFPLLAVHARLDCTACHRNQNPWEFANTPTECGVCHAQTYLEAKNPDHVRSGFSRHCEDCHNTVAVTWKGARFGDHNQTRFPLTGAHVGVSCERCHVGGRFAGTPTDCVACHQADYNRTSNPNHVAGGFGTRCQDCHQTAAWRPAALDHSRTRFPLTGGHAGVSCERCHVGGRYAGTSIQCSACHDADYRRVTSPNHVTGGFPTTCENCHTTAAWRPAALDHDRTRFPLTGAHRSVACERCHVGGRYAGTSTQCSACHDADYRRVTNPNHVTAGFPTTCESCHTTSAWKPATVDHDRTRFPLTGAHRNVSCERCHPGGRYAGTSTQCSACHDADYRRVTSPNHVAGGFPTTCENCHTTNAWKPATIDHDRTRFPLTGRHRNVSCERCHPGGRYAGTATDCVACHRADYDGTRDPNHAAAGFPTRCDECHTTNGWDGANFDHDGRYFPIYSGKHRGVWSSCAECHVSSGNYANFECIRCHAHSDKTKVDRDHREVGGYSYQSSACYRCHPRGVGGD